MGDTSKLPPLLQFFTYRNLQMSKFEVSQEFKLFAQQAQGAFQEAGKAEMGSASGCDLPIGTRGRMVIAGASAGQTKPKVVNGIQQAGKPYLLLELETIEPESHRGRKYNRYFDLSHHEKYSQQQKIQDFYDWMETAGLPREVRNTGDINQVFAWASEQRREFSYLIESGYQGRAEIVSVPEIGPTPTGSATQAAMAAPAAPAPTPVAPAAPQAAPAPAPTQLVGTTSAPAQTASEPAPASPAPTQQAPAPADQSGPQPGQQTQVYGSPVTIVSVDGQMVKVRNAEGKEYTVPVGQLG